MVSDSRQDKLLSSHPLLALSPDIPTDADALSARTQIRIAETEVHQLDVELSIILARRARIIARLERCRTVISPYKWLPSELVRKIIVLCLPEVEVESTRPSVEVNEELFRLRITQICATWRRIAFDESALWNLSLSPRGGSVELVAEWFRQCSSYRLGLIISSKFEKTQLSLVAAKIIAPYSKRFGSLSLPIDKAMLKSISPQPFESLEKLTLDLDYDRGYRWAESDLQFGTPIPLLRSLKVVLSSGLFNDRLLLRLPLFQLTNLEITGHMSGTLLFGILNECTSLEMCIIWGIYLGNNTHDRSAPLPDTTIHLPHLCYLRIIFVSDMGPLLFSLDTPNLRSLVINIDLSSDRCHSFFRRLSRLRCITVDGMARSQHFIDENFIASIPTSVEVTIRTYLFQHSTLVRIAAGELLPNVEHLRIQAYDMHSVFNILAIRNRNARENPESISFIKKATIFNNGGEGTFKHAVADLQSNGVDITLESCPLGFSFLDTGFD